LSSSSSSSSVEHRKKAKRLKKEKKEKRSKKETKEKKEKRSSKKEDKEKRKKKEKRSKKDKKRKSDVEDRDRKSNKRANHDGRSSKPIAIDQSSFGRFGLIREENFHSKKREFEAYMDEVHGVVNVLSMPKREMMGHYRTFMEDFNTATMPNEKYYNIERWEMDAYHQAQAFKQQGLVADGSVRTVFDDEAERNAERRRLKLEQEAAQFSVLKQQMAQRQNLIDDMRRQETLRGEQILAFKAGDRETLKKIERKLAPDQAAPVAKHPWAK